MILLIILGTLSITIGLYNLSPKANAKRKNASLASMGFFIMLVVLKNFDKPVDSPVFWVSVAYLGVFVGLLLLKLIKRAAYANYIFTTLR